MYCSRIARLSSRSRASSGRLECPRPNARATSPHAVNAPPTPQQRRRKARTGPDRRTSASTGRRAPPRPILGRPLPPVCPAPPASTQRKSAPQCSGSSTKNRPPSGQHPCRNTLKKPGPVSGFEVKHSFRRAPVRVNASVTSTTSGSLSGAGGRRGWLRRVSTYALLERR